MRYENEQILKNNIYTVKIRLAVEPSEDAERMSDFGEPEINIGGEVLADDGVTVLTTLPRIIRKIKTGFPIEQRFSVSQYANAQEIAEAWANGIHAKLAAALTILRAKVDDFTEVSEVDA